MRGFDGTNRSGSTQAGGWDREEVGLNGVFVKLHHSSASGKEGGASVVRNNFKRLFSAL
jgi:hypothetical protein